MKIIGIFFVLKVPINPYVKYNGKKKYAMYVCQLNCLFIRFNEIKKIKDYSCSID